MEKIFYRQTERKDVDAFTGDDELLGYDEIHIDTDGKTLRWDKKWGLCVTVDAYVVHGGRRDFTKLDIEDINTDYRNGYIACKEAQNDRP